MRELRPSPALVLGLTAILLAACQASGPITAERLDPVTGATIVRVTTPLVLYRDHSSRAAYARDYVNLAPIGVNRMGQYRYFLWLGIWSTMQGWDATINRDSFESVTVFADGEPLSIELRGWTVDSIGASEPVYAKPVASSIDAYYEVTPDQIRLITEARDVRLLAGTTPAIRYEPWDDPAEAQASLRAFLDAATF